MLNNSPWQYPLTKVNFNSIDFLSETQWLDWLKKELGIATTRSEKCLVGALFEKALTQHNAFDIWKLYCDFIFEDVHSYLQLKREAPEHAELPIYSFPDQCIEVLERALTIHGAHFISSPLLWNPYFELCREIGLPVETLRSKFQDRIRIPHRALSDTFSAYSSFEAKVDPTTYEHHYSEGNAIYQVTLAEVQWMEEYETLLLQSDKPTTFLHYIARLTLLTNAILGMYERALSETNYPPTVWQSYLTWTLVELKNKHLAAQLSYRAIKTCPQSPDLACYFIRLHTDPTSSEVNSTTMLPSVLYSMPSCSDFCTVLLEFLRFHQTKLKRSQLIHLIQTGFTVRSQLFPVLTEEPEVMALFSWCLNYLYRYQQSKETGEENGKEDEEEDSDEDEVDDDDDDDDDEQEEEDDDDEIHLNKRTKTSELYKQLLNLFCSSATLFKHWLPILSTQLDSPPHSKSIPSSSLFSTAVEKVKDHQDLVLELWLEYAYRYQTVEDIEYVRTLIQQHTAYVSYCQAYQLASTTSEPTSSSSTTTSDTTITTTTTTRKRNHVDPASSMDVDQDRTDLTFVVKHVSARQLEYLKEQYAQYGLIKQFRFLKSKVPGQQGQLFVEMDTKTSILNIFKHCQRDVKNEPRVFEMVKGATWDPMYLIRQELQQIKQLKLQQQQQYLEHQALTLFVANLAPSVSASDLHHLFPKALDVRLMQTKTGASKGYAYIQFGNVQEKEEALKFHGIVFKERVLYVAASNPELRKNQKVDQAIAGSRVRDFDPKLIFLTNVPFQVTHESLKELSQALEVRLVLNPKTKKSRGIAFCHYETEEQAQQAIDKLNGYVLDGRILEASIAQPTRRSIQREDYEKKKQQQQQHPQKKKLSSASSSNTSFSSSSSTAASGKLRAPNESTTILPPRSLIHRAPKKKVKLISSTSTPSSFPSNLIPSSVSSSAKDLANVDVDMNDKVDESTERVFKNNEYFRNLILSSSSSSTKKT